MLTADGHIDIVSLDAPAAIRLYAANGTLLRSLQANEASVRLDVQKQGLYIVSLTIGGETYNHKVVL